MLLPYVFMQVHKGEPTFYPWNMLQLLDLPQQVKRESFVLTQLSPF